MGYDTDIPDISQRSFRCASSMSMNLLPRDESSTWGREEMHAMTAKPSFRQSEHVLLNYPLSERTILIPPKFLSQSRYEICLGRPWVCLEDSFTAKKTQKKVSLERPTFPLPRREARALRRLLSFWFFGLCNPLTTSFKSKVSVYFWFIAVNLTRIRYVSV
jgi:hypothetical protein